MRKERSTKGRGYYSVSGKAIITKESYRYSEIINKVWAVLSRWWSGALGKCRAQSNAVVSRSR
jgi:hypothetical protein